MNKKILILGITLFSMFFGAGNLIFAPFLGAQAGNSTYLALFGMLITSVVCPIGAICIIAPYHTAMNMIGKIWKPLAPVFLTLVYLLIGPCIAIPRTASTAMEMWTWLIPAGFLRYLAIFIFFALAFVLAIHPGKLKDILGKILGPILILLILFLCIPLLFKKSQIVPAAGSYAKNTFFVGFNEGYQTMDILAAFCFSTILLLNVRQSHLKNESASLIQAAVIAGILLASIYTLLAFCSMRQSSLLQQYKNGAQILSAAARECWGSFGQILCGLIFLIACLNVCSSLIACCSEYFHDLAKKVPYHYWLVIFTLSGAIMACTGLDSILSWSGKLLSWICPIAILILVIGLVLQFKEKRA